MAVAKIFLAKLRLFERRQDLAAKGRYTITSAVDSDVVDLFFARVMGDETKVVTGENAEQLRALCDELEFSGFEEDIRDVLGADFMRKEILEKIRERLDDHDVRIEQRDLEVAEFWEELGALNDRVKELEGQLILIPMIQKRLDEVLSALQREVPERVEAVEKRLSTRVEEIRNEMTGVVDEVKREAGALSEEVQRLRGDVSERASAVDLVALSEEVARLKENGRLPAQQVHVRECVYDEAEPLNGIIAYLTRDCGGNVHEKGVVEVTASSLDDGKAESVVELGTNSSFYSEDVPDSWICYDFKGQRVTPMSYSIVGCSDESPRSWVLEVANDRSEGSWEVIDRRDNNMDLDMTETGSFSLDESDPPHNFEISDPPHQGFHFVRLRLTGPNHSGNHQLCIASLEIFGTIADC